MRDAWREGGALMMLLQWNTPATGMCVFKQALLMTGHSMDRMEKQDISDEEGKEPAILGSL